MQLALGGRSWAIQEPVFKVLRRVIGLYNRLGGGSLNPVEQSAVLVEMMQLLVDDARLFPPLWYRLLHRRKAISHAEIEAFLTAVPIICGLEAVDKAKATAKDPWGEIYAFFACCNGYTWAEIDNTMTLSGSEAIQDYWLHNPPEHIIQKAKVGYDYKKPKTVADLFGND